MTSQSTNTPTVAPISLNSVYHSFSDFKHALNIWQTAFGHRMRVGSSEILNNSRGGRDEVCRYRSVILHCVHFGKPNDRGGVRARPCRSAVGCGAMLRLNFKSDVRLLHITYLVDKHTGHTVGCEEDDPHDGPHKRFSDELVPSKKARLRSPELADQGLTTALPVGTNIDASSAKSRLSCPLLAALAIFNSSKKSLANKEICTFIEAHFTAYSNSDGKWKNGLRNILRSHKYFAQQIVHNEGRDIVVFSIREMDKFAEELAAFQKKYSYQNSFGLADPKLWEPMTRGELGDPHPLMGMDLEKINHTAMTMTEDEEVAMFCNPGSSKHMQQFMPSVASDRSTETPDSGRGSSISPTADLLTPNVASSSTYPNIVKPVAFRPNQPPVGMTGMEALNAAADIVSKEYTDISHL